MKTRNRKATDYLSIGDTIEVPSNIAAPIIYSEQHPNGKTMRVGKIVEKLIGGAVAVQFADKKWDYSNREALQFRRFF